MPLGVPRPPDQQRDLSRLQVQHGLTPKKGVRPRVELSGGLEPLDAPAIAGQGALEEGRIAMLVSGSVGVAGRVQEATAGGAVRGDRLRPRIQTIRVETFDGLGHEPVMITKANTQNGTTHHLPHQVGGKAVGAFSLRHDESRVDQFAQQGVRPAQSRSLPHQGCTEGQTHGGGDLEGPLGGRVQTIDLGGDQATQGRGQ